MWERKLGRGQRNKQAEVKAALLNCSCIPPRSTAGKSLF